MKTYPIKRLSLYLTLLVAGLCVLEGLVLGVLPGSLWLKLILMVGLLGAVYVLTVFLLTRYINDKIEPIYKVIREIPLQGKAAKNDTQNVNEIADVHKEVELWAKNQTQEITRLKDLERYRKEFVGNVSHELKTPIFNIQGYILTLLEGGLDDPKINKLYLKRTEKSIDRMISIVEDLESITKLESGVLRLRVESFDIVKLVEDVLEMEQMMANERKMQLLFERPDKSVLVRADKKRMTEVVSNLVANGIKYGRRKGFVKVTFYDLKDHLMIEVMDNGIGIDKNDLPRVFERFYRVDKSRSREQGGTGLGLSIVKHIIEAHKQTINVKSEVDEGTTFTFTLEKAK
ncbi:sensor histidine kinase [Mangrovibacterium lignilyticum]|uniref:sensor histidine kinase n=1 Tax=Mangrovibacterium lignilyticum TaxID=2668052 RepID=UPI0013D730F0|nr:ATP-binding protein [Mangrovibacterium lignilyticum]